MGKSNQFDRACEVLGIGDGIKTEPIPIVPDGAMHYSIKGRLPPELSEALYKACSYTVPDAKYNKRFKRGVWDGYYHLLRKDGRRIPKGLFPLVAPIFKMYGLHYSIQEQPLRIISRGDVWNTLSADFRPEQIAAITEAVNLRRGVISLPTGVGKTWVAMGIMKILAQPTLFVVTSKELMYQTVDMLERFFPTEADQVGMYGDGLAMEGNKFTVAIANSVTYKPYTFFKDFKLVIFDECHHLGAKLLYNIGRKLHADHVYGMSATIDRTDGHDLKVQSIVGPVIYHKPPLEMIELDRINRADVELYQTPKNEQLSEGSFDYSFLYKHGVVLNEIRNGGIVHAVKSLLEREMYPIYVHVTRTKHGDILEELIKEITPDIESVYARNRNRKEILEDYKEGKIKVLVSTLLGEGVDIPLMQSLVLAGGGASEGPIRQIIGRVLRPNLDPRLPVIVDFDDLTPPFKRHSENRLKIYREMTFNITNVDPQQQTL